MPGDDDTVDTRFSKTLRHPRPDSGVTRVRMLPPETKYTLGALLGRGGVGEVHVAHDRQIGREIAIKRLHTKEPSRDDVRRFLREARIQALLDHPAIVPVHEVGEDEEGRPYFTMKRLVGVTLAELLAKQAPQQRLLRAFAEVALAIDRAHSVGVIHRDLKPANIMLGDYGEVYVLDWGLARVETERAPSQEDVSEIDTINEDDTMVGTMLGTPGYMSPEQARNAHAVDSKTDIYALGSILFEILTGEPLHPRGYAAIASTLADIDTSPTRRRPDRAVPPELDALCRDALRLDAAARPTARALADRVQSYLDGDRDLARRREMAGAHLADAREELASDDRAQAMRSAARALALDPAASEAADLVTRLMLEPPKDPPPALRAELEGMDAHAVRRHVLLSIGAYSTILAFVPVAAWNGIRNWALFGVIAALCATLGFLAWTFRRRHGGALLWVYTLGNGVLMALFGGLFSPFIMVPAIACVVVSGLVAYPSLSRRAILVTAVTVIGWGIPIVLERIGALTSSWAIVEHVFVIRSHAVEMLPSTIWMIISISAGTIVVAGYLTGSIAKANFRAQRTLATQAWQLRQLLPTQ